MGAFSGWVELTGETPSAPAIGWNNTNQRLYIVVRGTDSAVYGMTVDSTFVTSNGWIKVPIGATPDAPAVAFQSSGTATGPIYIVVRGFDNSVYNLPNF
jgi:hypothetical protein